MAWYRLGGQEIELPRPFPEIEPFRLAKDDSSDALPPPPPAALTCRAVGWVGGAQSEVEVWSAPPGVLLRTSGGRDFYLPPDGSSILDAGQPTADWTPLDGEILLGPALLLALASRGTFGLHASAAAFRGRLTVFLGESGAGKSTLAAYLPAASREWTRVGDDILPVAASPSRVEARPRSPQLKLAADSQPGAASPEQIPVSRIILLEHSDGAPAVESLPRGDAAKTLIGHTAAARLFDPRLLAAHLAFCADAARRVPAFRLSHPRRMDALPRLREILETLC